MFLSSVCCSGLAFAQKSLLHYSPIHPFEMAYWYGMVLLVFVLANMKWLSIDPFSIPVKARKTLLMRGVIGMIANCLFNMSMQLIPMSKASVLFWTSPIVVALLSRAFLKERLSLFDWLACFLAFLGIVLIQNPFQAALDDSNYLRDLVGTCLALLGALGAGIVGFSLKKLANMTHYLLPTATFAFFNVLLGPFLTIFKVITIESSIT